MSDTAQIIITLGVPAIAGFFAWLSRREMRKARVERISASEHAERAKLSADVATRASARATRYSEFDIPPDSGNR